MSPIEVNDQSDQDRPIRSFSPRMVPQLWTALLDSVETDVVRSYMAMAIEAGSQMFYGTGRPETAAKAVTDWHHQVLRQARLYHFSAELWAHAIDCEADWPEWTPTPRDFPTPYGMVVLERPIMIDGRPISVLTYGPGTSWPGIMNVHLPGSYTADGQPMRASFFGPLKAGWLVSAWTTTLDYERALGIGPLANENDFLLMFDVPGIAKAPKVPHMEDHATGLARAFKIAFDIATQENIALVRHEPLPRPVRKRAARHLPGIALPEAVLVHDLRPKLTAALGYRGGPDDPIQRADAHYRVKCWPVRPIIDPDSGEEIRRGYIAYRDPALLEDDALEPVEVWRGTDLKLPYRPRLRRGNTARLHRLPRPGPPGR